MDESDNKEPTNNRANVNYWLRWIPAAKDAAKDHWEDAKAAWQEYTDEASASVSNNSQGKTRYCPLYWSSCQTVESAYYAKTPNIRARRRFDIEDPVALTGSLISERLSVYLMENSYFDSVMRQSVGSFLHAAKTTTQVCFEPKKAMQTNRVALNPNDDGAFYAEGSEAPHEGEVFQDEQGYFANIEEEVIEDGEITLKAVCHDEILHTPEAKGQDEITEIAYFCCIPEEEARERFPNIINLPFKTSKQYERKSGEENRSDIPGRFLECWEIYDKVNKKIYWINESYKDDFLGQADDPYGFRHFFPSPAFVIANKPEKSLFPRPAFVRLSQMLTTLHTIYGRRDELIDQVQRVALVDGNEPELVAALNRARSGQYVECKNLGGILAKGGINNVMLWVPIQELISAISEINSLEAEFKNAFYEFFGMPDILRGVSDPQEALGTQQIKASAAHDRFKNHKKMIQELARDSIEMMLDLALQVFPRDKIWRICGMDFAPQEHRDRFDQALAFLQNDEERLIRIDIETDSTSFIDSQAELFKRKAIAETVITGLATIGGMQNLEFASVALRTLLSTISGLDGSKEYEDGVIGAVKELMQKKQQPQEAPPDVKMLQVQVQQQKVANDAMIKQRELELKEFKLMEEQKQGEFSRQLDVVKTELEKQMQEFVQMIEAQRLKLDEFETTLSEREKLIEEQRLAMEVMQSNQTPPEPKEPQAPQIIHVQPPAMPPINISVDAKSGGRKVGKIVRNPLTGEAAVEFNDVPEVQPVIPA